MNTLSFLFAAIGYIILSLFLFISYPRSWRTNRKFVCVLILWHILGASSVIVIFTGFSKIPYENIRYEITRIGTCYYVMTTIMAILFFFRLISHRTYQFVARRTGKKIRPQGSRRVSDKQTHCLVFIAVAFGVFAAGYFNIDFIHLTEYDVSVSAASAEDSLDICLISDLHAGSGMWGYDYDGLADQINRADADVILIAGDVFDETTNETDIRNVARIFEGIKKPRCGIYYVYGNHDSNIDDWAAERMREMGVNVLKDEMAVIGEDIQLLGRLDPKYGALDMDELIEKTKPDPDKPILVLAHRPLQFKKMSALGCDLAMAGHTHGFNIPQFLGSNILEDMYYGIKEYGDMTAITSSGVSAWGYHYKWPAISEVVKIHLTFNKG